MAQTIEIADPFMTPADIADYLRMDRATVFRLLKSGRQSRGKAGIWPTHHPTSRITLVRRSAVDRYVESRRGDRLLCLEPRSTRGTA